MTDQYTIVAILLVVLASLIIAFWGLHKLNEYLLVSGKHPWLKVYMDQAITMAYKASDYVFDATSERLHCLEKQEIIKNVYDILPDKVNLYPLPLQIPWKRWVDKDQFVVIASAQYDKLVIGFDELRDTVLKEMLDDISPNRLGVAKK